MKDNPDISPNQTAVNSKIRDSAESHKGTPGFISGLVPLSVLGGDGASLMPHPLLDTYTNKCCEDSKHGQIDKDFNKREKLHKSGLNIALKLRNAGMNRRAERMEGCGKIWYRASCTHCGTVQTFNQSFNCMDRLCPSCQKKRSAKMAGRWKRALDALQAQEAGVYSYFFTLTYKDHDKLRPFASYTKPRRELLKHSFWKQYGLIGGISAFEIKVGENSNLWHPHYHCILFTRKPIECIETGGQKGEFQISVRDQISDIWEGLTGDSSIVDGRIFDGNTRELTKYITKNGEELSDKRLAELAAWAKGKRFVSTFGVCYNNPAMRAAMEEEDERPGRLHRCDCGCDEFEVDKVSWRNSLNSSVIEKVGIVHSEDQPPGKHRYIKSESPGKK